MDRLPLIKVRKGKIMKDDKIIKKDVVGYIENLAKEYGSVYAIDLDGYRKNSANLGLYKKVARHLWIDAYPRYVEDVMDLTIIGTNRITIWNMDESMLKEVREMIEKDVYLSGKDVFKVASMVKKYGFKGIVLHEGQEAKEDIETWKIYLNEYVVKRIR